MLESSGRKEALWILAFISFAESSFFPIPPDVMLIPMVISAPNKAFKMAGVATLASVIGGYFGYVIGVWGFDLIARPLLEFYGYTEKFASFKAYYAEYGAWIVFFAGLTPFPYKVITIASGAAGLNIWVFTVASLLARGLRFYAVAGLLKYCGERMKNFIEKHFNLLSILFFILLLGSFLLIKYL